MSSEALEIAKRLLQTANLKWESSELLKVAPDSDSLSFADIRKLEDIEVYKESLLSPRDSTLEQKFDAGGSGYLGKGDCVTLRVPRRVKGLVVAKDLADLLTIPLATTTQPKTYLLTHSHSSRQSVYFISPEYESENPPSEIQNYHRALRLWKVLEDYTHHTSGSGSLLYFGIRRTEIRPGFMLADLERTIELDEIEAFISNGDRHETRVEIFNAALSEFLKDQNPDRAFAYLLRENERFARRLREGLALFLSQHSPEKLEEEGRALHFDIADKLEKSVQAIELKSLSIPVSLLLVVKQIEASQGWSVTNSILISAVSLYAVAMVVAHFSYLSAAKLVKQRIDKSVQDLTDQGLEKNNPLLSVSFKSLRRRNSNGVIKSWIICILSFTPVAAVWIAVACGHVQAP